jgi:hypothetical protein
MSSIVGRSLFWTLAVVALIALAVPVILHSEPYVPMTLEQAKQYITFNPDAAARDIVKLDLIEHSTPEVRVPALVTVLRGRDLIWGWDPTVLTVTVPGVQKADPAAILYVVDMKGGEQKDFTPTDRTAEVWVWRIATFVAAFGGYWIGHSVK